jgi:TonB family protein
VSVCLSCGKSLDPTWTYCGSCGAKIDVGHSAADQLNDHDSAATPTLFANAPRESRIGSVVLTTVVIVLILAGSLWIGYQQESPFSNALGTVNPGESERNGRSDALLGQDRWSVERTFDPLTDTEVWTATSRVRSARQETVVPIFGNPQPEPQTISAIYEARFRYTPPASLEMTYTIYDALPTGTQFDRDGSYREVAMRFDDAAAVRRRWSVSSEYPNVGSIRLGDPMAQLFAIVREALSEFEMTRLNEIAGVRRRILIQGLRAADEFIEFPIDESFEPFRAQLQKRIGEIERRHQAQTAAAAQARQIAEAAPADREWQERAERLRQIEQDERLQAEAEEVLRQQDQRRATAIVAESRGEATVSTPIRPPAVPAVEREPVRVGGDIQPPTKTKHMPPVYPPIAQSARVQGVVIIETVIGSDGKVRATRVIRSIPLLDQAALDAVRQWEFTPTLVNGVQVPVIMTVTVQFTLS